MGNFTKNDRAIIFSFPALMSGISDGASNASNLCPGKSFAVK